MSDFIKLSDMPEYVIEKYANVLPEQIINFWKKHGISTAFNGYLKAINPEDFTQFVSKTFILGEESVPLFVTAFGDVITMTKYNNEYKTIYIIKYKDGYGQAMLGASKLFFQLLSDDYFLSKYFELDLYNQALERLGALNYTECFTFTPLLSLGGSKNIESLDKGGIAEYLMLITEFIGGINQLKDSI